MKEFSIAIPYSINEQLKDHLIIGNEQEEVAFAFWYPSYGKNRLTALIHSIEFPNADDRILQGNVIIQPSYFKRVCKMAMQKKCGIALLHSHPGTGWKGMSPDDLRAETKFAPSAETLTDIPFIGLTVAQDGAWSGRLWEYSERKNYYKRKWARSIRVSGERFEIHDCPYLPPKFTYSDNFKRTLTVWGKENHIKLSNLRIGIVGLGSVGSIVAETLARMGMQKITLIDFDKVKKHNLDRTLGATGNDIGKKKVKVIAQSIAKSATAEDFEITTVQYSLAHEKGYRAALDCDVLFSCVDRPRPRYILNHISYNHLIPVIDGGIQVRFDDKMGFIGAEWQVQTVAPGLPCLECLEAYSLFEVDLEINGLLDDPTYLKGLPKEYLNKKNNENIFPFSTNLASMEVFHLIALVTEISETINYGVQRYRFNNGIISNYENKKCREECCFPKGAATGDKDFIVFEK